MTQKPNDDQTTGRGLSFAGIAIAVLWLIAAALALWGPGKPEERGQFGDTFGALNTLFSGAAFAVFVYTMLLQRQELRYQREELALQREEMKLSRAELAGQRAELDRQNELTALSAKLAALPILISNSEGSLFHLAGKGFVGHAPPYTLEVIKSIRSLVLSRHREVSDPDFVRKAVELCDRLTQYQNELGVAYGRLSHAEIKDEL